MANFANDPLKVTTEDINKVRKFCNQVRLAGGANPLDALLPAVPGNASTCLIARNLNFSCEVRPAAKLDEDDIGREEVWYMFVNDDDVRKRIATAIQCPIHETDEWYSAADTNEGILLPEWVGNIANAFDNWDGLADDELKKSVFHDLVDHPEDYYRDEGIV